VEQTLMRALIMDDAAKAEVARVKAHAEAHHYYPGRATPGDDPKFVARLSSYRAVFTYTHADGMVYRDLSVSVPSKKLPNPAAVFAIAGMFGFTGYDITNPTEPGTGWLLHHSEQEHCIRCVEPMKIDAKTPTN
jgi:hypothetical protein